MWAEAHLRGTVADRHETTVSYLNETSIWRRQQCSLVGEVQGKKQALGLLSHREHELLIGQVDLPRAGAM